MNRAFIRIGLLVFACLIPLAHPGAQGTPDPWFGQQDKPKNFEALKAFTGAFSIQLPKDWQLAPGHTGTIFSVVEKTKRGETGGLITLEYMSLQAPLEPALVAGVSERELKEVQSRELSGKQFSSAVKTGASGPIIFIQYDRPALAGTDHVAQYSMPIGKVMYRLICIAPAPSIDKYKPIFAHVAASFAPVKTSGSQ